MLLALPSRQLERGLLRLQSIDSDHADLSEDNSSPVDLSRVMDARRRLLRTSGTRLGELDSQRLKSLHELLLRRRLIRQPIDLSRAVNYVC
jgi:hypothetical protein